jgi:short-subunit dehydrogenase
MILVGRSVLLTGATGGIGQAIARRLAAAGAQLTLTARRAEVLDDLAAELGARVIACDLADREAVLRLAADAGGVDVLVANAALPASGPLIGFSPEEIDRALDVNLRAPIQLSRALIPGMVERGAGHVVLMSSLAGRSASGGGTALYSATKFGLRGFGQSQRTDLRGTGVGVSVVFPGFVRDAGMFADSGAELPGFVKTSSPEEVADAVADAIERDRGEVDVAPLGMRAGARLAETAPALSARVTKLLGSDKVAHDLAAGQADKR